MTACSGSDLDVLGSSMSRPHKLPIGYPTCCRRSRRATHRLATLLDCPNAIGSRNSIDGSAAAPRITRTFELSSSNLHQVALTLLAASATQLDPTVEAAIMSLLLCLLYYHEV